MSRLTLLLFLVALTGISIVHGQGICQKKVGRRPNGDGWSGRCFGTYRRFKRIKKCDAVIKRNNGCKGKNPFCCVKACSKQTKPCNKRYNGSYGKNDCNCANEFKVGEVRPGSGCNCCKICKRKRRCRKRGGQCITREDPVHNEKWCRITKGWKVAKKACYGWGCFCCYPPKAG